MSPHKLTKQAHRSLRCHCPAGSQGSQPSVFHQSPLAPAHPSPRLKPPVVLQHQRLLLFGKGASKALCPADARVTFSGPTREKAHFQRLAAIEPAGGKGGNHRIPTLH